MTLLLKKTTNTSSITPTVEISSDLKAPITKSSVIGTISYSVDGNEYTSNLLAGEDVIESNAFNTFLTIVSILLVLYLLYKLLNSNNKKKTRRKKNSKKGKKSKASKHPKNKDNYLYW